MKRACMVLAMLMAFVVFGMRGAQAQYVPPGFDKQININDTKLFESIVSVGVHEGDVQEEVEILRRLLEKSFKAVYGPLSAPVGPIFVGGTGTSGPPPGMGSMMGGGMQPPNYPRAERPAPDLEGVYLKDYGVLYTVTLPPPPNNMLPGPTLGVVTRTPLSPWERTRKELRGERIEDDTKPVGGSPSLSEVILKVLADNGKHFTRLADGERITVAVTFFRDDGVYRQQPWSVPSSSPGMPSPGSSGGAFYPGTTAAKPAGTNMPLAMAPTVSGTAPARPAPEEDAAWLTDVRNSLLLGDLHVKQQKHQEANAAYQEAVDKLDKALAQNFQSGMVLTPGEVPGLLTGVNLYNKLAQVYAKLGNPAAAREMLQKASTLTKKADDALLGGAAATNPQPATLALPSKLIVSASKKLLDEVGSGKTTFEGFCKAATVENIKPAADKK